MSRDFVELSTERLQLREVQLQDAEFIHFMRSDPGINALFTRPPTKDVEDAKVFIAARREENGLDEGFYWSIFLRESEKILGTICLHSMKYDVSRGEIGYDLHPDYHGHGYMGEAVKEVLQFGFSSIGLATIIGITTKVNVPSQRVLQKAGFLLEDEVLSPKDKENDLLGFELKSGSG